MALRFWRRGPQDPLAEKFKMPAAALYLNWGLSGAIRSLEFDITMHTDPGTTTGIYFAAFGGGIADQDSYAGIQTNVYHPEEPPIGKGAIFSTWWTFDRSDAFVAEPDGFHELGTHEGKFLGVRRPFGWTTGHYRFTVQASADETRAADQGQWFDCFIVGLDGGGFPGRRPNPVGEPTFVGALRFPAAQGQNATITNSPHSFLEVYADADTFGEIDHWHIDVMAYGNGTRAHTLETEYAEFRRGQWVPNADAWYDATTDRANIRMGGDQLKSVPPGRMF